MITGRICTETRSPVVAPDLDEWDKQLKRENTSASAAMTILRQPTSEAQDQQQQQMFLPLDDNTMQHDPALERIAQLLHNSASVRGLKEEIARVVLTRAFESNNMRASPSMLASMLQSEATINGILEEVARQIRPVAATLRTKANTHSPPPADSGRQTIERELVWAEVHEPPPPPDVHRPCAPVEGALTLEDFADVGSDGSDHNWVCAKVTLKPKPKAQHKTATPKGAAAARVGRSVVRKSSSTVTRSRSSAFSECSAGSYGSYFANQSTAS